VHDHRDSGRCEELPGSIGRREPKLYLPYRQAGGARAISDMYVVMRTAGGVTPTLAGRGVVGAEQFEGDRSVAAIGGRAADGGCAYSRAGTATVS